MNRVGDPLVTRIEGETNQADITEVFSRYFKSVYSGHETREHMPMKSEFYESFNSYFGLHVKMIVLTQRNRM